MSDLIERLRDTRNTEADNEFLVDEAADEIERLTAESGLYLALLDRIEIEQDYTLAKQRFDIARELGYTVEFGEQVSGEKQ